MKTSAALLTLLLMFTAKAANASVTVNFGLTNLDKSDGALASDIVLSAGSLTLTITAKDAPENSNEAEDAQLSYHSGLGLGVFNGSLTGDTQTVYTDQYRALDGNQGDEQMILSLNHSVAVQSISFFDLPDGTGDDAALYAFDSGGWTINEGDGQFDNKDDNRFAWYGATSGANKDGNAAIKELRETGTDTIGKTPDDGTLRITVTSENVTIFLSGIAVELTDEQAAAFGIPEPSSLALLGLGGLCLLGGRKRRQGCSIPLLKRGPN